MSKALYRWTWFFIFMVIIFVVSGRGWFDDLHPVALALTAIGAGTVTFGTILGSEYILKQLGFVRDSKSGQENEVRDV